MSIMVRKIHLEHLIIIPPKCMWDIFLCTVCDLNQETYPHIHLESLLVRNWGDISRCSMSCQLVHQAMTDILFAILFLVNIIHLWSKLSILYMVTRTWFHCYPMTMWIRVYGNYKLNMTYKWFESYHCTVYMYL